MRKIIIILLIYFGLSFNFANSSSNTNSGLNKSKEKERENKELNAQKTFLFSPGFVYQVIKTISSNAPFEKVLVSYPHVYMQGVLGKRKWFNLEMTYSLGRGELYWEYNANLQLNSKIFFAAIEFSKSTISTNYLLPYDVSFEYYIPIRQKITENHLARKFGIFWNIPDGNNPVIKNSLSYISLDYKINEKRDEAVRLIEKEEDIEGWEIKTEIQKKFFILDKLWLKILFAENTNTHLAKIQIISIGFNILKLEFNYESSNEEIMQFFRNNRKYSVSYQFNFN